MNADAGVAIRMPRSEPLRQSFFPVSKTINMSIGFFGDGAAVSGGPLTGIRFPVILILGKISGVIVNSVAVLTHGRGYGGAFRCFHIFLHKNGKRTFFPERPLSAWFPIFIYMFLFYYFYSLFPLFVIK